MTKSEIKEILAAMQTTRALIETLSGGREMLSLFEKMIDELNENEFILTGMIDEEESHA